MQEYIYNNAVFNIIWGELYSFRAAFIVRNHHMEEYGTALTVGDVPTANGHSPGRTGNILSARMTSL